MSERKVLNKYYPPDFDPSKIPRLRRPKETQQKVRLMAPFSMRCMTCGDYIAKGKKFNARKETVEGEVYLGIKIFRFYIRCPKCSVEITFKTDPKNSDYTCEQGAMRNFEPWREERIAGEELKSDADKDSAGDPMRALERRTEESKREMEIMDALDEIRIRNARNERVDQVAVLDQMLGEDPEDVARREEEELDRLAREAFACNNGSPGSEEASDGNGKRAATDEPEPDVSVADVVSIAARSLGVSVVGTLAGMSSANKKPRIDSGSKIGIARGVRAGANTTAASLGIAVRRKSDAAPTTLTKAAPPVATAAPAVTGLVGGYGSSSDDDDDDGGSD